MLEKAKDIALILMLLIVAFLAVSVMDLQERIDSFELMSEKETEQERADEIGYQIDALKIVGSENKDMIDELSTKLKEHKRQFELLSEITRPLETYDLGEMNNSINSVWYYNRIWRDKILRGETVDFIIGYSDEVIFDKDQLSMITIRDSAGESATYNVDSNYTCYGINNYGYALVERNQFVDSVLVESNQENSFVIVDNTIKYIFMAELITQE